MTYLVEHTNDYYLCCQRKEFKDPCASCYPQRKWENCKDYLKMQGKGILIMLIFIGVIGATFTGVIYVLKGNRTNT